MVNNYVAPEQEMVYPETKKVKFESNVLFNNITFLDYTSRIGEKGEFIVVKAIDSSNSLISFATSSAVLMKQIKNAKETGKLKEGLLAYVDKPKGKRYYTLTAPTAAKS